MAPILGASNFSIWARIVSTTDLGADRLDFRDVPRPDAWDRRRRPQCCLTEPFPRSPAESLQRPADADRGHDPPCGVDHRCADRRHTRLTLLDALRPSSGPVEPVSTLPADPRSSGSRAPSATIQRRPWGDCSDTTQRRPSPSRTNSCTLSPVSSRSAVRTGRARSASGKESAAAWPRATSSKTEAEPPVEVAAHKAMLLERRRQAMGGRSRQPGRGVQLGECARSIGRGGRGARQRPCRRPRRWIRCPLVKNSISECETLWQARRRSRRRCGSATSCARRPASRISSTSTCTSSTRSPARRRSTACASPGVASGDPSSPSPPRITTSRPPTSISRSPIRCRPSRSRCCARTSPSSASRTTRWATPARASCTSSGRSRAARCRA